MITVIVRFPLPQDLSSETVRTVYEHSAPQFQGAPGLIRKYYLHGADQTGGGVYLWENREAADNMHSETWRRQIAERFGAAPQIEYFDSLFIIDNTAAAMPEQAASLEPSRNGRRVPTRS
ncbi:hypothetical protein AA309_26980 [Microvirga vignae]|uniref:Monooxygenase n=2 Tax=Microvirga vignae TaxID=1225564 RepID=A0A0H1R596_9HYPH|nr:hypothetical protein AA309_26980 [Microvirga vignae]